MTDPALYAQKTKLELLLERLEANPNPPEQKPVVMTEYHASVAMAAMEALPEIRSFFSDHHIGIHGEAPK